MFFVLGKPKCTSGTNVGEKWLHFKRRLNLLSKTFLYRAISTLQQILSLAKIPCTTNSPDPNTSKEKKLWIDFFILNGTKTSRNVFLCFRCLKLWKKPFNIKRLVANFVMSRFEITSDLKDLPVVYDFFQLAKLANWFILFLQNAAKMQGTVFFY